MLMYLATQTLCGKYLWLDKDFKFTPDFNLAHYFPLIHRGPFFDDLIKNDPCIKWELFDKNTDGFMINIYRIGFVHGITTGTSAQPAPRMVVPTAACVVENPPTRRAPDLDRIWAIIDENPGWR